MSTVAATSDRFRFHVEGTAADGQTWFVTGRTAPNPRGAFASAIEDAQQQTFDQLTQGKATYGRPGQGGCRGPYTITRFTLELDQ